MHRHDCVFISIIIMNHIVSIIVDDIIISSIVVTIFVTLRQAKSCAGTTHPFLFTVRGWALVLANTLLLCLHRQHQWHCLTQQRGVAGMLLLLLLQLPLLHPAPPRHPH